MSTEKAPTQRDPYRVLGVPPMASESEIKKAYRNKSKEYHPDLNPDIRIWADEKMKELVEAYNLLSDDEKKKAYDMTFHLQYRRERKKKKQKKEVKKSFMDKISDFFQGKGQSKKSAAKHGKGKKKEIEYNPKEAEIHYGLGVSMCDNNTFINDTIDSFKKATLYDPEHLESHYNLGIAYYRKGEWGECTSCFQKVLKLDPADEGAKHLLTVLKEDSY